MKALAVSVLFALTAAPALAEPARPAPPASPPAAQPAAEPSVAPGGEAPEAIVDDVSTPEARRRLMMRCSGPPPRREPAVAPSVETPVPPAVGAPN